MYEKGEILEVVTPFGPKDNKLPKGTKVEFIKAVDNADLAKSLVAVQYEDRVLVTLETNVRIKSWWRRRKAFKQFNYQMMVNNPRLRRYHPNFFLRCYYKSYYYIVDKFRRD